MALTLLLTNDDGIGAPGLEALRNAVSPLGRVITVAPEREQSASSHAITLHHPLRIHEIAEDTFTVDGRVLHVDMKHLLEAQAAAGPAVTIEEQRAAWTRYSQALSEPPGLPVVSSNRYSTGPLTSLPTVAVMLISVLLCAAGLTANVAGSGVGASVSSVMALSAPDTPPVLPALSRIMTV